MDRRPLDLDPTFPQSDGSVAHQAQGDLSSPGGTGLPGWAGPQGRALGTSADLTPHPPTATPPTEPP
jgi:hypothetical protein